MGVALGSTTSYDQKRLFLALELPSESKQAISQWRAQHFAHLDKKPIPPDNYHITLVFLGDTSPDAQQQLLNALAQPIKLTHTFPLNLHIDTTAWWLKPKLIYLAPSSVPEALIRLQQTLNERVEELGLPTEIRPYQPHISVYRKINAQLFEQLQLEGLPQLDLTVTIKHFALYQSVSGPDGVVYEVIKRFKI